MNPVTNLKDSDTARVPASGAARISLWVYAVAMLGSLLLAAGAAIAYFKPAMLLSPLEQVTDGVRVYAGYMISRNAALALLLLAGMLFRVRTLLGNMLLMAGAVQIFDACIDGAEGRWMLVPGVAVLGIVFLLAAAGCRPARQSKD